MSNIILPYNNVVKRDYHESFDSFMRRLVDSNGLEKGRALAIRVKRAMANAVTESFKPYVAPMRNKTRSEINRRIDLCIEIVLSLDAEGFPVARIEGVVFNKLKEKLSVKDEVEIKKGSWGERVQGLPVGEFCDLEEGE